MSADFAGKTAGGDASNAGVITTSPGNRVEIVDQDDFTEIEDGTGKRVYGRVTEAASVWTLSFYVNDSGVETAHNLASTDIKYFYREVFTSADRPTIGANVGLFDSLNAVQDIPDATDTQPGKVNIGAQTFGGVKEFDSRPTTGADPIVSEAAVQDVSNKAIITPSRLDVKQDTEANLVTYAATASNGQLCFATDTKVMYQVIDSGLELIAGSGGGGGLDVFATETYEETVAADLASGNGINLVGGSLAGSLADDGSTPISGDNSVIYTQAAGSLNDYFSFFPSNIALDPKQQGREVTISVQFEYDGGLEDIRLFAYDETNSSEITITDGPVYFATTTRVNTLQAKFFTQESTASLRVGATVETLDSGKELKIDDIELKINGQSLASNIDEQYTFWSDFAGRGSTATKVAYFTNERKSTGSGLFLTENDSTDGFRVTLLRPCRIEMTFWAFADAATHIAVGLNGAVTTDAQDLASTNRLGLVEATATSTAIQTVGIYDGAVGDVFTPHLQAVGSGSNARWGVSVKALAKDEIIVTPSDNIMPVRYSTNAGQSFTTGITDIVNFDNKTFDDSGLVATGAGWKCTSPINKRFRVSAAIMFASSASNYNTELFLYKSGFLYSRLKKKSTKDVDTDNNDNTISGTDTIELAAGDYIDIRASQDSGGNLALSAFDLYNYVSIEPIEKRAIAGTPQARAIIFKDVKSSGTAGGSNTGGDATDTRTLNTIEGDTAIGSLSSNQMTMQPGTYVVSGQAPASEVGNHKAYLYNTTDAANEIIGSNGNAATGDIDQTHSFIKGIVIIDVEKTFEVRHQTETASATTGFGHRRAAFGTSEVYAEITWLKIG